jgi:hypothetical protein
MEAAAMRLMQERVENVLVCDKEADATKKRDKATADNMKEIFH